MSLFSFRHIPVADQPAMPWKNGRGVTVEVAREDDAAGLVWRVSLADVVETGPFSLFPGLDRILTLIEGPGFGLDFGPHGRVALAPFAPVAFSGDWTTHAVDVAGPCRDLNLMTARGRAEGAVRIHRSDQALVLEDRTVVRALEGAWTFTLDDAVHTLAAGEAVLLRGNAGRRARLDGKGIAVEAAIHLTPA